MTQGCWTANRELGIEERAWLDQIVAAPGFRLTCAIQRWWREIRLKTTARFTLLAVPSELRAELLSDWLDSHADTSFFYAREASAFLDYILGRLPDQPHLESICRFERAVLACSTASATFSPELRPIAELAAGTRIARHHAATVVDFAASPETIFASLLAGSGTPLPEPVSDRFSMVVAPRTV